MKANTLNICLGHIPFPERFIEHVDVMIAPCVIAGVRSLVVVDDSLFGANGSSLSEYVQLLWLFDNFDAIASDFEFVRVFQYRRFVSRNPIGLPATHAWEPRWISANKLDEHAEVFSRFCTEELFNRPVELPGGMLGQYATAHILTDALNFARFLIEEGILESERAAAFLTDPKLIAGCNSGIFALDSFKKIFATLKRAAAFVYSPNFVMRTGYQRRSVGFLLERLNSFLLFERMRSGASQPNFGHHILISDGPVITRTT
jgi:hypothetical protein